MPASRTARAAARYLLLLPLLFAGGLGAALALIAGLVEPGRSAAERWLWTMGTGNHDYDPLTRLVWLVMLAGPLVFGSYYLVYLVRGSGGVG